MNAIERQLDISINYRRLQKASGMMNTVAFLTAWMHTLWTSWQSRSNTSSLHEVLFFYSWCICLWWYLRYLYLSLKACQRLSVKVRSVSKREGIISRCISLNVILKIVYSMTKLVPGFWSWICRTARHHDTSHVFVCFFWISISLALGAVGVYLRIRHVFSNWSNTARSLCGTFWENAYK